MTPIQQLMLGTGSKNKVFLDDVFSTYLWEGNATTRDINNGIDLAGEGGLVWIKNRENGNQNNLLFDTTAPPQSSGNLYSYPLQSNANVARGPSVNGFKSFNSNGFSVYTDSGVNQNDKGIASWSFRKAPGFFDVVTYSGDNSSNRAISHSLGSVPGLILVKCTSTTKEWHVWHRDQHGKVGVLNTDAAFFSNSSRFPTIPTSTNFYVGNDSALNDGSSTYVAYVFAGGESTAATARSVDFDGSNDVLNVPDNDAWDIGSVDCTLECWVKFRSHNSHDGIIHNITDSSWDGGGWVMEPVSGVFNFYYTNNSNVLNVAGDYIPLGQWQHIAVTKSGSTLKVYQDGNLTGSGTITGTIRDGTNPLAIGGKCFGQDCNALISNVRITIGQVLYTSSFKPSTVPLTTTSQGASASNVKLLCCNNSSITGSTVTTGTITAPSGVPTASIDSPFDDPAAFIFGENEDQNVIKTGSYTGNGSSTGPEINLGWEPQWFLIKRTSGGAGEWVLYDALRGISTGGPDAKIAPNTSDAEFSYDYLDLTSTGFKINVDYSFLNNNNNTYVYVAIRRPDSLVQKPQLATDVFNMVMGTSNSDVPAFASGFVTDFAFNRIPTTTEDMWTQSRLTGDKYLRTNSQAAQASSTANKWDYNNGWYGATSDQSTSQSWMWKRHAGSFDVVAFQGTTANPGPSYRHSLGKVPELKILKRRNANTDWFVTGTAVSQAVGGNNNAKDYYLKLNSADAATTSSNYWDGGNDTSTHFTVRHGNSWVGGSDDPFLCLLFASVTGISKCGYYTGDGTTNGSHEITLGFTPRFLMIKCITSGVNFSQWNVWDSLRGLDGSGIEYYLKLNSDGAQVTSYDYLDTTSTGFKLNTNFGPVNGSGNKMIYYAHA